MRPVDVANNDRLVHAGRDKEMQRILTGLRQLPSVVLVEGEAGIGKSRLIHEAVSVLREEEVRIAWGACHPLRERFPYHALIETLRSLCGLLPDSAPWGTISRTLTPLLPELASRLPRGEAGPDVAAAPSTLDLLGVVRSLLESLSPVVMVVEDVHWSDETSRELLLLLARNMPRGAGLVLSYRKEDLPFRNPLLGVAYAHPPWVSGLEIHLAPLDEGSVHHLAVETLGHDLPREVSRSLHRRSDGIPMVLVKDLAALCERGTDVLTTGPDSAQAAMETLELPRAFTEVFAVRVARLPPDAICVVQAAAVLGAPFDQSLVTEVAGLGPDRCAEGLVAALEAGVLHEAGPMSYAFPRSLGRIAVYEDIPGPMRQRLHRQALNALWTRPRPALGQIARQARRIGDNDMWIRQATTAADQAIAVGDTATAVSTLYEILDDPGVQPDQLAHAALMLARVACHRTEHRTMARALRRVLTAPALPIAVKGEIRLYLALLTVNHRGEAGGYRDLMQAVEELQARPELLARAQSALAMRGAPQSDGEAQRWLDAAEAAARSSPDEAAAASVTAARLTLSAMRAGPDVWDAAEHLPRQIQNPDVAAATNRALHNVGDVAVRLGHDDRARRLLGDSKDMASFHGNALLECYSSASLLQLDWWEGEWKGLEQRLSALCEMHPEMAVSRTTRAVVTGSLALTRGEQARALHHLRTASVKGERYTALWATALIAGIHLADGEAEEAWSLTSHTLQELCTDHQWWQACGLVPVAVEAALACGRSDLAHRVLAKAESVVSGQDVPAAGAELYEARGHVQREGDPARAAAEFERARTVWQAIGRPYRAAQAVEKQADALVLADYADRAGMHLRAVIESYSRLEATSDVARCERKLREIGQVSARRRGRRSYGSRLSPRELEVARLVAGGASNRDIARVLFLSPRTVEHHVTKVLRKLDVSHRHAVDEALAQIEE